MSRIDDTNGFRLFAGSLERTLATYEPPDDLLLHQRAQLKALIAAEATFRKTLLKHKWGPGVYRDFVVHICEERKNILAARPYFRERQTTFTATISKSLKKRHAPGLYKYRFNWTFIVWALGARKWHRDSPIRKIAKQIEGMRTEILQQNIPLAISQARIFWNSTPKSHLTYMDIVQIQCQALLLAIDKFTPPDESKMTKEAALIAWKSFRGMAVGVMKRDRVNSFTMDQDTILVTCDKKQKKIKEFVPGDSIWGVNNQGETIATQVVALHDHGVLEGYEVTFDDGYQVICSSKHKFLTQNGMVPMKDLGSMGVLCDPSVQAGWMEAAGRQDVIEEHPFEAPQVPPRMMLYSHAPLASTGNLVLRKVVRVRPVGERQMYDVEVDHIKHNFLLPNGIVTSNSETLVHFYPGDKLKIYTANRNLRRLQGELDYAALSDIVNHHLQETNADVRTNPEELAGLLAGASTVSGDFVADPDGETVLELTAGDAGLRPDAVYEGQEAEGVLHNYIRALNVRERKLLVMKGVSP